MSTTRSNAPKPQFENLDVLGSDQEHELPSGKGFATESAPKPPLYSLSPRAGEAGKLAYRSRGTRRITLPQAANLMEAVAFARSIGLPLVAHLTIHWAYTDAGDKVREGLDKWLRRHGIVFAGIWSRERMSSGQAEVVHCHLLFHLPAEFRTKRKWDVERAVYRLIKRHGRDCWSDEVGKLVIWPNPDGKYLIKGGGTEVWKRYALRKEHRRRQGLILARGAALHKTSGRRRDEARHRMQSQSTTIEHRDAQGPPASNQTQKKGVNAIR